MAKQFSRIEQPQHEFILRQRLFFTATAAPDARVNVSPKPTDALRVIDANTVVYLDLTGSGNETAAHVRADGRLTLMFCAFEGSPVILRLYGRGRIIRRGGPEYAKLLDSQFAGEERSGARQIVSLDVELVQTSCGFGVPLFEYRGERSTLHRWATEKGEVGLNEYRRRLNARSMDGLPTGISGDDDTEIVST